MESLSRPFHRSKHSNASSFSGKNAYDGVFSGHRPNYGGAPAANVEDYREIFSSAPSASSIPVLDLSTLEESSDGSNSELGSSKPDYGKIFGGFRDEDIAVSYEQLFARDKARAPSSTSGNSQDLDDSSHQCSDALKQFNMSYHKISQGNKDGLDGTTHVTQLHAVPGFTCFIDETAPPEKEIEKKKSSVINNVHPSVDSIKEDFPEKKSSPSGVRSTSLHHRDESLPDDIIDRTFVVSSSHSASVTDVHNRKNFQKRSTTVNSRTSGSEIPGAFSPTSFDEELDVNSTAAASAAALKRAIEKAQESIRIAKEAVGRKKEGLCSFSSRSFKDSLKAKARPGNASEGEERNGKDSKGAAPQVFPNTRRNHKYGGTVVFPEFTDGEKLFGAKKVIDKIHVKISESAKISKIPIQSSHVVADSKMVCNPEEVVGETEAAGLDSAEKYVHASVSSEAVENNTYDALWMEEESAQTPKDFLVIESCKKKVGEAENIIAEDEPRELKDYEDEMRPCNAHKLVEKLNNLIISEGSNVNEAMGLLENEKQEVPEIEDAEKVENAEKHDLNNDEEASDKVVENEKELKEEDKAENFYDVYEPGMNEIMQINADSLGKSEASPKEDRGMKEKENHEVHDLEIYENSSSDYDDAEESESACNGHAASKIVTDTQEAREIGLDDKYVDLSEGVDDVSSSSTQVEDTVAIEAEFRSEEKEIFEKISLDQTTSGHNEDEREAKADLSNCRFADVNFGLKAEQNDTQSESSSDTVHGMEIEVNECKERSKFTSETEMGASQEPKDEIRETGPSKEQHKRIEEVSEREKNILAVERAIREARERAFAEARERAERAAVERVTAEVRQRVMNDARKKLAKASAANKPISAQAKLRAERAAVERATSEARQRALEKAMSLKNVSETRPQANEIRRTSSSDLHSSNGTNAESFQRSKAKLEKQNRIMERVAKALAEKEKRDLLAQKEQAERSRLAENLDADIKRWSSGKEGNLRALLSTLQYILGAESGWQPVSLTEIITASAVKKAYRKATLCVHPDKLQQRGANIQHKYICEKVFDLLKAAWNRFNSEER